MTNKRFQDAVRELLAEREMSGRELMRQTREHQGWGSTGALSLLMAEEAPPSTRAMEAIAAALQVKPEHFAEYRLAKARAGLDPAVVGFERAFRHGLKAAEKALAGK